MRRSDILRLLFFTGSAEAAGLLSALITGKGRYEEFFRIFRKPPLLPPAGVFPVVWAVLYALMGISAYIIFSSESAPDLKKKAVFLYCGQLVFNFSWSIIFFRARRPVTAAAVILILIILCIMMIQSFRRVSRTAGTLNVPYLLWLLFAAYLNTAVIAVN